MSGPDPAMTIHCNTMKSEIWEGHAFLWHMDCKKQHIKLEAPPPPGNTAKHCNATLVNNPKNLMQKTLHEEVWLVASDMVERDKGNAVSDLI